MQNVLTFSGGRRFSCQFSSNIANHAHATAREPAGRLRLATTLMPSSSGAVGTRTPASSYHTSSSHFFVFASVCQQSRVLPEERAFPQTLTTPHNNSTLLVFHNRRNRFGSGVVENRGEHADFVRGHPRPQGRPSRVERRIHERSSPQRRDGEVAVQDASAKYEKKCRESRNTHHGKHEHTC